MAGGGGSEPGHDGPDPGHGPGGGPNFGIPAGTYGQKRDASGAGDRRPRLQRQPDRDGQAGRCRPSSRPAQIITVNGRKGVGHALPRDRLGAIPRDGSTTVVAIPLRATDDTLQQLLVVEALVIAGVLIVLGLVSWVVVRVGLLPLDRMGHTAGAIAGGDLSHRVESTDPRTEVGRLGISLNAMLDRLERAFGEREASEDRLRRFIADASHELRTPLASIRGYAELFRMGAARDPADVEKAMGRIEDEAARMGVLVEDLLTLARLDEVPDTPHAQLDLAALVRDAVDDGRAAAPGREIGIEVDGPALVLGDRDQLRQVLGNLLRNAFVHTPEGTPIEVSLAHVDGEVRLEVRDHGPGPADQRRRGAVRALLALGGRARARARRRRARPGHRRGDRRRPRRRRARGQRAGRRRHLRRHAAARRGLNAPLPGVALSAPPTVVSRRAADAVTMTDQTLLRPSLRTRPAGPRHVAPSVEVVVPVFNEQAALERSIRRLHRFLSAELPVLLADRHRRQREHRRDARHRRGARARAARRRGPAPGPQGPRAGPARGVVAQRRARALLHGRRPVDRPARPAAARGAAAVGPQRRRHRHAPGPLGARRARPQARAHLALLQPPAAHRAARALLRRAVRLQGRDGDGGPAPARRGPRRRLVLRHRAARARPAHAGCASTRSRSTGSTTPTRASTSCAPRSRTCAASRAWRRRAPWCASWASACSARSPTPCSTCCCTARSAPAGRTPSRSR